MRATPPGDAVWNSARREPRACAWPIGAIFKNEGPYILEWVAYHRALGIDRFFVADNGSDDGSSEFLAALDRAGVLDHIPPGYARPAAAAARLCRDLRRHGAQADWIAFIDADEFLWPAPPLALAATGAGRARRAPPGSGRSRSTGRPTARPARSRLGTAW